MRIPKRLFYSMLIVLLWLGFVIDGAHALFQSSAALTGNAISTGSSELLVSNSQNPSSTIFETSRPGFTFELDPGKSAEKFFLLKNSSDSDIGLDVSAFVALLGNDPGLSNSTTLEIGPVDEAGNFTGPTMVRSMQSMVNNATPTIATIPEHETLRFKIKASLAEAYAQQNQSLGFDLVFLGTQNNG